MSVYKVTIHGNVRWRAELNVGLKLNGDPDIRTKTCKTEKEAIREEKKLWILRDGLGGRSDRMTLAKYWTDYYLPEKKKTLRASTVQRYESVWKCHLEPTLGDCRMADIDKLKIKSLLSSRSSHKVATNTRDLLRQILGEALDDGAIRYNPAAGRFTFPEKVERKTNKDGEWVSDIPEHMRMIDLAEGNIKMMLILGLCFGLRKAEIVGMRWEHIDLKNGLLLVRNNCTFVKGELHETTPKNKKYRDIPMTPYAKKELLKLRGNHERIGVVLIRDGKRMLPHEAKDRFGEWVSANNVPKVKLFTLRHSYATAMIKNGMPVEYLSKILGHASVKTTWDRYVKPLKNDLEQAVFEVGKAYSVI